MMVVNVLVLVPMIVHASTIDALLPSVMRRESQRRSACGERLCLNLLLLSLVGCKMLCG